MRSPVRRLAALAAACAIALAAGAPSASAETPGEDPGRAGGLPGLPAGPRARPACADIVSEGVRLARAGDLDAADGCLTAARIIYPDSAAPWREAAGVRFLQRRWREAARFARRATALAPADSQSWRLLAGSLYMDGDPEGALRAWNAIGEPRADSIRLACAMRTSIGLPLSVIDLRPGDVVTDRALRTARRRMADLPSLAGSRIDYVPGERGNAAIDAAVVERPVLFDGWPGALACGASALIDHEVILDVASPAGLGEAIGAQWRWDRARPLGALDLRVPFPGGAGVLSLGGAVGRESYSARAAGVALEEDDAEGSVGFSDWIGPSVRLVSRIGVEKFSGGFDDSPRGPFGYLRESIELRLSRDRLNLRFDGTGWSAPFYSGAASARLTLRRDPSDPAAGRLPPGSLALGAYVRAVSGDAPLHLWPGAGTGSGRPGLLRAHPLLDDGVIDGRLFGRTLAGMNAEAQRGIHAIGPLVLSAAAFVDAGRVWRTAAGAPAPSTQVDMGGGLRLGLPGSDGYVGFHFAHGLRDGASAVSLVLSGSR